MRKNWDDWPCQGWLWAQPTLSGPDSILVLGFAQFNRGSGSTCLEFPNAVVLNAVVERKRAQMSANKREKRAQKRVQTVSHRRVFTLIRWQRGSANTGFGSIWVISLLWISGINSANTLLCDTLALSNKGMSARERKGAEKGAKERFRMKIANKQVWDNHVWELPNMLACWQGALLSVSRRICSSTHGLGPCENSSRNPHGISSVGFHPWLRKSVSVMIKRKVSSLYFVKDFRRFPRQNRPKISRNSTAIGQQVAGLGKYLAKLAKKGGYRFKVKVLRHYT